MRQARLQDVCEDVIDDVDGALGCALVDVATGLPLALDVKPNSMLSSAAMELISAAGVAYFRENMTTQAHPEATTDEFPLPSDHVQEIQATTADTYNFMSLVPDADWELLILIADRKISNLGLGWMAMRQALALVTTATNDEEGTESSDMEALFPPPTYEMEPPAVHSNRERLVPRARKRRTIWGER